MSKQILFSKEARAKLRKGVDAIANAVKVTLGAKGRTVMVGRFPMNPHVTKDGYTVARAVEIEDHVEHMGAQVVREAAQQTVDAAGDGTTSSCVLAQAIVGAGLDEVDNGANPIDLKRGIDKAVKVVVENLKAKSTTVGDDYEKIKQIASISANNDEEIGELITQAMKEVGKDGVIYVEEGSGALTEIKTVDGMQFDRGWLSPHLVTDFSKMEAVLEDVFILICDRKITNINDIMKVLEFSAMNNKSVLVIGEEVSGDALSTLVVNKNKGQLRVAAVTSPEYGEFQKAMLQDIASLTGGMVVSEELDRHVSKFSPETDHIWLGKAKRVVVGRNTTTIVGGKGDKQEIEDRITQIKAEIESTKSDYNKDKLSIRLARLSGGVAVLSVGAASEVEMKEKKDRVDDALWATRSAVEEGVIAGGGVTLARATQGLEDIDCDNEDQLAGVVIVTKAIQEPLIRIVANATGDEYNDVSASYVDKKGLWNRLLGKRERVITKSKCFGVVNQVLNSSKEDYGYNVRTEEFGDMVAQGVIDPTKVARVALENAASVASTLLTTDCVITLKPIEK